MPEIRGWSGDNNVIYLAGKNIGDNVALGGADLSTHYGLTPDEYRQKWSPPADYPMVAPAYVATRSALAKMIGLGRKKGPKATVPMKRRRKAEAAD